MTAGVYIHYKGGLYQTFGIAEHTETNEKLVMYIALTGAHLPGPRLRARPLSMWADKVVWPDGFTRDRFVYMGIEVNPNDQLMDLFRGPSVKS